ncbi:hypothetical protein KKB99_00455, partial [bacterium]|nr:hypothetical protein [bacterium]MBU1024456.1 hypothetical protein [bacterium]
MKLAQILTIILLMVFIAFLSNACSKGKSPVEPVIDNSPEMLQDIPDTFGTGLDQRKVLSVYDCVIDPDAKTFTAEPINRSADYHYPLTSLYPNVLQITGFGWTP